jgi:lysophospholipase
LASTVSSSPPIPKRFEATQALLRRNPDLRLAGPTWGFIEAAYRSIAKINAPGYPEAISTPVLIVGAGKDRIVVTEAEKRFRNACHVANISK